MNIKPKENGNDFCIGLAVGRTELPMRKDVDEFKRKPISEINEQDNVITQAVRLAPSSLNSQPWEIRFEPYCIHVDDAGHGFSRLILKNKLNKIDVGIAARHAVVALENEGSSVTNVIPEENGKQFGLSIIYQ